MEHEDLDIYSDLPQFDLDKEFEKVQHESALLRSKVETLSKEIAALQEKKEQLEKERTILEKNISILLKTAKEELRRKDRIINELREKLTKRSYRRSANFRTPTEQGELLNENPVIKPNIPAINVAKDCTRSSPLLETKILKDSEEYGRGSKRNSPSLRSSATEDRVQLRTELSRGPSEKELKSRSGDDSRISQIPRLPDPSERHSQSKEGKRSPDIRSASFRDRRKFRSESSRCRKSRSRSPMYSRHHADSLHTHGERPKPRCRSPKASIGRRRNSSRSPQGPKVERHKIHRGTTQHFPRRDRSSSPKPIAERLINLSLKSHVEKVRNRSTSPKPKGRHSTDSVLSVKETAEDLSKTKRLFAEEPKNISEPLNEVAIDQTENLQLPSKKLEVSCQAAGEDQVKLRDCHDVASILGIEKGRLADTENLTVSVNSPTLSEEPPKSSSESWKTTKDEIVKNDSELEEGERSDSSEDGLYHDAESDVDIDCHQPTKTCRNNQSPPKTLFSRRMAKRIEMSNPEIYDCQLQGTVISSKRSQDTVDIKNIISQNPDAIIKNDLEENLPRDATLKEEGELESSNISESVALGNELENGDVIKLTEPEEYSPFKNNYKLIALSPVELKSNLYHPVYGSLPGEPQETKLVPIGTSASVPIDKKVNVNFEIKKPERPLTLTDIVDSCKMRTVTSPLEVVEAILDEKHLGIDGQKQEIKPPFDIKAYRIPKKKNSTGQNLGINVEKKILSLKRGKGESSKPISFVKNSKQNHVKTAERDNKTIVNKTTEERATKKSSFMNCESKYVSNSVKDKNRKESSSSSRHAAISSCESSLKSNEEPRDRNKSNKVDDKRSRHPTRKPKTESTEPKISSSKLPAKGQRKSNKNFDQIDKDDVPKLLPAEPIDLSEKISKESSSEQSNENCRKGNKNLPLVINTREDKENSEMKCSGATSNSKIEQTKKPDLPTEESSEITNACSISSKENQPSSATLQTSNESKPDSKKQQNNKRRINDDLSREDLKRQKTDILKFEMFKSANLSLTSLSSSGTDGSVAESLFTSNRLQTDLHLSDSEEEVDEAGVTTEESSIDGSDSDASDIVDLMF